MEIQDADDKDDDPERPFKGVQIQLAPSETKPYTRYSDSACFKVRAKVTVFQRKSDSIQNGE